MLQLLHIENIAVIERSNIQFDSGFNVLTGETGAGKSIVIDAISAILGARTYRDLIRTGAEKAFVSAVFTKVPVLDWFTDNGVPYDPDELLISRDIYLDGKNVCRVNGQMVTVAMLRKLGSQLIQIHGQHDSQQLFDEANHLASLDRFAANEDLRRAYLDQYALWEQTRKRIAEMTMDEGEKLRRMETLQYQIQELEEAALQPGEEETLEARRTLLRNAERLTSGLDEACQALYGGEDSDGAAALIEQAAASLHNLARFTDQFVSLTDRTRELALNARDVAEELRDIRESFVYSEDELDAVEARLALIGRLRKKYGVTVADILAYLDHARQELDAITFSDERLTELRRELELQEQAATRAALELRENRKTAALGLQERIRSELAQLDMPNLQFECQFDALDTLGPDGLDRVRFLMSANLGEALKPMSKIASGGELARIMLAMQNVMAENEAVPTLIFDEVDAGVSGRAAQKVAEKLQSVAKTKQVLCVTHLAQLAALADTHFLISKTQHDGRTYTSVQPLDRPGREEELARIIGGAIISDTTRKSAAEMLEADKIRREQS